MRGNCASGALGRPALRPARELQGCRPQAGGIGVEPQNDLRSPPLHAHGEAIAEAATVAPAGRGTEHGRAEIGRLRCVSHPLRDSLPTS